MTAPRLEGAGNYLHPPKTNMDTQNDGLEKVTPGWIMAFFLVSIR